MDMLIKKSTSNRFKALAAVISVYIFAPMPVFALGCQHGVQPVTISSLQQCVDSKKLNVSINQGVVDRINYIRGDEVERMMMQDALVNMDKYRPVIVQQLNERHMPLTLLALPMVESGYRPLDQSINPMKAAGIWQLVPETAGRYGLVLNKHQDDRLNTVLATEAALNYLQTLYYEFKDWRLAVLAYEIGMNMTNELVKLSKSKDPWVIARSFNTYHQLKSAQLLKFLVMYDAAVIIISHPELVQEDSED